MPLGAGRAATIHLEGASAGGTVTASVPTSDSDGHENSVGSINITSLNFDIGNLPLLAVRFVVPNVLQGATASNASVVFSSGENRATAAAVSLVGEAVDNAPVIGTATNHLSGRRTAASTTATVAWTLPAWALDERGPNTTTPDIATILSEIFGRAGWAPGNAVLLFVVDVSGDWRRARSFDYAAASAASLSVTWSR